MKTFTVIALYDAEGIVLRRVEKAADAHAAMAAASRWFVEEGHDSGTEVVCAIEGDHEIVPPCEDAERCASIVDLAEGADSGPGGDACQCGCREDGHTESGTCMTVACGCVSFIAGVA